MIFAISTHGNLSLQGICFMAVAFVPELFLRAAAEDEEDREVDINRVGGGRPTRELLSPEVGNRLRPTEH